MKTAIDNVESVCYTILALGYRVSESTITVAVASFFEEVRLLPFLEKGRG